MRGVQEVLADDGARDVNGFWKKIVRDAATFPTVGDLDPTFKLTPDAIKMIMNSQPVVAKSLKIRIADIIDNQITVEVGFCDKNDVLIVAVAKYTFIGTGSTLTVMNLDQALTFVYKEEQ